MIKPAAIFRLTSAIGMCLFGCTNDIYLGSRPAAEIDTETEILNTDTGADEPVLLDLSGELQVLDPTIIEFEGTFLIFHTGPGISVKRSDDLHKWRSDADVFETKPNWITTDFPQTDVLWGPDISYFGGLYHLYYGVSTFGSNASCIGHATAADLNEGTAWTDLGATVCTTPDDDWNAIDPNWIRDENGDPWLVLGSYWTGIKAVHLDESGNLSGNTVENISSRGADVATAAPLIIRHADTFYHFVSFDQCCMGVDSTHNIRVGRAETLLGPYFDFDRTPMLEGGGTLVLEGDDRWKGPGHNAVFETGGTYYNVYHAYDAENDGAPTLRISTLAWDASGLPVVAGP